MCNFCSTDKNIDITEKEFINENVSAGFLGSINVINQIDVEKGAISLIVMNENGEVQEFSRQIEYCPFCGRKLH